MKKILKLQRSESFYIRDGWIEKVFSAYGDGQKEAFSTKNGTRILGIGSNMVKSLRYWVEACQIATFSKNAFVLTNKGGLIYNNDPYMETSFSWCLLHYWLVTNENLAPVFYTVFNDNSINTIKRKETAEYLVDLYKPNGFETANLLHIQKDLSTLISSYVYDEEDDSRIPEDNISSPLAKLRLMKRVNRDTFEKTPIPINLIDYRSLFICLRSRYPEGFSIDETFVDEKSPVLCLNIERGVFLTLLDEMRKNGLIDLNRTAGLNMVYINFNKTDDELFDEYMNDKRRLMI